MKEERLKEHKFRKEKKKGIWGLLFGGNWRDFWEGFRMLFWKPHTQLFVDIHWRFTLRLKRWVPTYLVEYEGRGSADAPKRENKERMRDYFSKQGKTARGLRDFLFQSSRTILGMRGTLISKIDNRTKRKNERRWESKQRAEWGVQKKSSHTIERGEVAGYWEKGNTKRGGRSFFCPCWHEKTATQEGAHKGFTVWSNGNLNSNPKNLCDQDDVTMEDDDFLPITTPTTNAKKDISDVSLFGKG